MPTEKKQKATRPRSPLTSAAMRFARAKSQLDRETERMHKFEERANESREKVEELKGQAVAARADLLGAEEAATKPAKKRTKKRGEEEVPEPPE